jgi:hypothetical protein
MTDGRTRHHRQGRRGDRLALTRLVTAAGVQPLASYLVSLLAAQLLEHYPPPLPGGTRASCGGGSWPQGAE